ncbi:MAG: hypothetical protein HFG40_04745 [Bacilli bacterium]|nr:hypothetical protein [Bacilli bacterium]
MRRLYVIETLGKMGQDTLMIQLCMETKRYQRDIIESRKLLLRGSMEDEEIIF